MIPESDRSTIVRLAAKHRATRVLLFGSAADEAAGEARDIDLAVEGVAPRDFFRLYADLLFAVSKPVDLVDLESDTSFTRLICQKGVPIYERS